MTDLRKPDSRRDTGESGETYNAEMLSDAFNNNMFHNPLSDKRDDDASIQDDLVPQHLQEPKLRKEVSLPVCDEKVLFERVLGRSAPKSRTPYGSPYHRTIYAKNYRKDLDKDKNK